MMSKDPIFIIGAARSGTNMLRDILSSIDGYCTWDCDEINPILRHGNLRHPSDVFTSEMATPVISDFIRSKFNKISKKHNGAIVIEKTCANTLRLPFLASIFPKAKFIFIYRDGRDSIASTMKRWKAPFELKYSLKKARYIPIVDIHHYLWRFGKLRLEQMFGSKRLKFWGVKIPDLDKLSNSMSLLEIAAYQWSICNQHCIDYFSNNKTDMISIKYESFVRDPASSLLEISTFIDAKDFDTELLSRDVRVDSIGKYKKELSSDQLKVIEPIILKQTMSFGY